MRKREEFSYLVPTPSPRWKNAKRLKEEECKQPRIGGLPLREDITVLQADKPKPGWDIPVTYTTEDKAKHFDDLCKAVMEDVKETNPNRLRRNQEALFNRLYDLACGFPSRWRIYEEVGAVFVNDYATTIIET
jgi:hypothetical protein